MIESDESFIDTNPIHYKIPDTIPLKRLQKCPGIDSSVVALPSEFLGGDFIDTMRIEKKGETSCLGIFLYDVMGHGIKATNLKACAKREFGLLQEAWINGKQSLDMRHNLGRFRFHVP